MDEQEIERLVMVPTARRRLGRYVLLGRLGAGGMGKIYLAYAPGPAGIEKFVVIKRLHSHLMSDQALVTSFLDEARLSMALSHPNIVHTFDVGDTGGRTYMVMEHIDGQNLGVLLRIAKKSAAYPASGLWAGLFTQVLDALSAAHTAKDPRGRSLDIIHRDVSPQNILITYDGVPKLVDFGIAKAQMRLTGTDAGTLKGKYAYMSPEQVRGDPLDARSDLFAAGIVLWEMLAGRRLYKADTVMRSVERILHEPLISPLRVNPTCDPALAEVALRALQKDRNDRYPSALAMKDALEDALHLGGSRFRRDELSNLMQELFGEVAIRQRALVEASLNIPAEQDEEEEDSRDTRQRRPRRSQRSQRSDPNGSRSGASAAGTASFAMPRLPVSGTTPTGAAQLHLPVVIEAKAASASSLPPSLPMVTDEQAADDVPLWQSALRWLPVVVVPALTLLAWWWWQEDEVPAEAPMTMTTPIVVPEVVTAPPVIMPPVVMPSVPPSAVLPTIPLGDADLPATDGQRSSPRKTTKQTKEPKQPKEPKEPKEEVAVEAPAAMGTLTLDTVPWTTVYLGKQKLGETPLVGVPVPAGALELVLINSEQGIKENYAVKIRAGADYKTRLDLK